MTSVFVIGEKNVWYANEPEVKMMPSFIGEGLRCWECNSKYDPNCGEPFKEYTISLVDCSQRFLKQNMDANATICRKITQKEIRGLFWDGPRNFEPRSDDEDDAGLAPPSPNFRATPTGGRLATAYGLACNGLHARRIFGGIEFRAWSPPPPRPRPYH
ncbi:hypothetical protein AVEN_30078-1 [Araneus ventricosus]|uniref:Uncharacterized protein n=1 Tax=Araneus ventricosus TaxID=182803 RepID=A0A4Y2H296_ARAVE|nr:hypothetical protein AVEN_30078-1 [Araneus ventricosus]